MLKAFLIPILILALSVPVSRAAEVSLSYERDQLEKIKEVKRLEGKNAKVILKNSKTYKGIIFDITDTDFKAGHPVDPVNAIVQYSDVLEVRGIETKRYVQGIIIGGVVVAALLFVKHLFRDY